MCSIPLRCISNRRIILNSWFWDIFLFSYILEVLCRTRFWAPKQPPEPLTLSTRAILDIDHLKIATFCTYLNNNFIISECKSKQEPRTRPDGRATTSRVFSTVRQNKGLCNQRPPDRSGGIKNEFLTSLYPPWTSRKANIQSYTDIAESINSNASENRTE